MTLKSVIVGQVHLAHAAFGKLAHSHVALSGFGLQRQQLKGGAAEGKRLAGLQGDGSGNLPVVHAGAKFTTGILKCTIAVGDCEAGVLAGNLGAGHGNLAGTIAPDEVLPRLERKPHQFLARLGGDQLKCRIAHVLLAATHPTCAEHGGYGK